MIRKSLIAFAALAACAFAAAPSTAAPPDHAFRVTARSVELCPTVVAAATDTAPAATVADREPINRASASVQPRLYAATLFFVGADTSPGAPAPFDPGRLRIA